MSLFGGGSRQGGSHQAPRRKTRKPAETEKYRYENLVQEDPKELEEDFNGRVAENLGYKKPRPGKKPRNKGLLIAAIVLGCLALILVMGLAIYMIWSTPPEVDTGGLNTPVTAAPLEPAGTLEPGETATPEPSPTATPEVPVRRENTYTILVVGRDRVGLNTDTIMVAMMDCDAGEINVVSIPRDTLVNVDWSVKKVNSIYGALGTEGLLDGISDLLGFRVDNYVIVNTYVFQALVDAIGGVYFDVPIYMYYDDPNQDLHISLAPGYQWLSGYQAEQVVRFRQNNDGTGYPDGDLGRIRTQQDFLMAVAKQILSLGNITSLPQLVDIVTSNTDTDLTGGNIAFYAEEFLKIDSENIHFYTMPYDSVNIRGGSYVSIQLEEWLDMVNEYLNPFSMDVTEDNVDILMYADGYAWSTTGYSLGMESFYDYYGAAAAAAEG